MLHYCYTLFKYIGSNRFYQVHFVGGKLISRSFALVRLIFIEQEALVFYFLLPIFSRGNDMSLHDS
jgi:hypothetical protein